MSDSPRKVDENYFWKSVSGPIKIIVLTSNTRGSIENLVINDLTRDPTIVLDYSRDNVPPVLAIEAYFSRNPFEKEQRRYPYLHLQVREILVRRFDSYANALKGDPFKTKLKGNVYTLIPKE
ncbi:MAG: hypothetical protein QXE31_05220 [Candidatus Woesearchaeota archaeon]